MRSMVIIKYTWVKVFVLSLLMILCSSPLFSQKYVVRLDGFACGGGTYTMSGGGASVVINNSPITTTLMVMNSLDPVTFTDPYGRTLVFNPSGTCDNSQGFGGYNFGATGNVADYCNLGDIWIFENKITGGGTVCSGTAFFSIGNGCVTTSFMSPYLWQVTNVASPAESDWKTITNSGGDILNLSDAVAASALNLSPVSTIYNMPLYVRIRDNRIPTVNIWDKVLVTFKVPSPSAVSISTQPSCSARSDGRIIINSVTGVADYPYKVVIRSGNNSTPCNPDVVGDCNTGVNIDDNTISLSPLPKTFIVGGGNYTVLVVNGGGTKGSCYLATPITVPSKTSLGIYNLSPGNISCYANNEGSVSFEARDGDTGVRSYNLQNNTSGGPPLTSPSVPGSTLTFSGLSAGAYSLAVNDGGCSAQASETFNIIRPKKVIVPTEATDFGSANATCLTPVNGYMTINNVTKTNGAFDTGNPVTSTYRYRLFLNGNTSPWDERFSTGVTQTWNNLPAGNYLLRITENDGLDCNGYTKSFSVTAPSPLGLSGIVPKDVKCNGDATGELAFSASGGNGSYKFDLKQGATIVKTNTVSPLTDIAAGVYTLSVSTPGCADSYVHPSPITIGQPSAIGFSISSTNSTCYQADNGTASASISGGTPNFTYIWEKNNGASWLNVPAGSGADVSDLGPGSYRLRVTDANSCRDTSVTILVTEPSLLTINSITPQDVRCFEEKGTITINSGGGTAPRNYYYSDDDGATFKPLVPLNAGTYNVKVVDSKGCEAIDDNYYTITAPDEPLDFTYELSSHNGYTNSCFGDNTGIVTLTASGGNDYGYSGYTFTKDAGAFTTPNVISNILAGSHSISAKDGRGCVVSKSIPFTQPDALTLSLVQNKNVICFGLPTGEIEVSAAGGVGTYEFWLGTSTPQPTGLFTGITSGNYVVTVKDGNTCETVLNQTITNLNPPINVTPAPTDVQCFGGADGRIGLTVFGGVPSYQYAIGTTTISNPVTTLTAGVYKVTVTDSEGCQGETGDVTIGQPTAVTITDVQLTDIRCLGENGAIAMTASGGTSPYTFEYSLDNGTSFSSFTSATPLNAGNYRVRTKDDHNCILLHTNTFSITNPPAALNFTNELSDYHGFNITCSGLQDGFIRLTPSGGNGASYTGYSYKVDTQPFQLDNLLTGISAGSHLVSIKDGRGCIMDKTISFTEAAPVTASMVRKQDVICFGAATGELETKGTGGTSIYKYKVGTSLLQDSPIFLALVAGDYVFTVQDENNCEASLTRSIVNLNPAIAISLNAVNDASCYESKDGSIALNVTGGVSPYAYKVGTVSTTNPAPGLGAGTYRFTITDNKGCEKQSADIEVKQPNDLVITNVDVSDIRCYNDKANITITATGGTEPYTFENDFINDGINKFNVFTNTTPLIAGDYKVRVTDAHNCISLISSATITQPLTALDFSYVQSDYNGYNISCFGGYNGHITLTPTGGNGASYSGYEYTIDNKPYQSTNKLVDIYGGNHKVAVRDGRQCIVEKTINFTQSSEEIKAYVARRKDVICVENLTGEIEVKANGGGSPYKYRLTTGSFQDSPTFTGLGVNTYQIIISDVNDCAVQVETFITNLTREMQLSSQITDVSCFDGQDGTIEMNVTGGATPLSYKWTGIQTTLKKLTSLRTGNYTVQITDNAGCKKETTVTVGQPAAALQAKPTTLAACYGKSDGTVSVEASGGTTPYEFSVDGQRYNTQPIFTVAVGTYTIKVRDSKGCLATAGTEVMQRNARPEPNFLVAITRNALDTLVLTEICVPQPDSIHWAFDSQALIVDNNEWTPKIKFKEPGSYPVTMQGFFGGCDYTITKTLTVNPYDPKEPEEKLPGFKAIESVAVSPNPTKGDFAVEVKLTKKYNLSLILIDMLGVTHYQKHWEGIQGVNENISLNDASSGVYLLRVITETGAEEVRVVVAR